MRKLAARTCDILCIVAIPLALGLVADGLRLWTGPHHLGLAGIVWIGLYAIASKLERAA